MSESDAEPDYRISRQLESVDREIERRRQLEAMEGRGSLLPPGKPFHERGLSVARDDLAEQSRRFAGAPWSTHAKLLLGDGVALPAPERLRNSEEVEEKLWQVINALAVRRVFIRNTNHLTDRELYAALWAVHLNEATRDLSDCPGSAGRIDLLEGAEEGERDWYERFYASREEIGSWRRDPDMEKLAEPSEAPYDRDRHLPKQGIW